VEGGSQEGNTITVTTQMSTSHQTASALHGEGARATVDEVDLTYGNPEYKSGCQGSESDENDSKYTLGIAGFVAQQT